LNKDPQGYESDSKYKNEPDVAFCPESGKPVRQPCPYCLPDGWTDDSRIPNFSQWCKVGQSSKSHRSSDGYWHPLKHCPKCGHLYPISNLSCGNPICKNQPLHNPFSGQRGFDGDPDNANSIDFTSCQYSSDKLLNEDLQVQNAIDTKWKVYATLSTFGWIIFITQRGLSMYHLDNENSKLEYIWQLPYDNTCYQETHTDEIINKLCSGISIGLDGSLVLCEPGKVRKIHLLHFALKGTWEEVISVPGMAGCFSVLNSLFILFEENGKTKVKIYQNQADQKIIWESGGKTEPIRWDAERINFGGEEYTARGLRPFTDDKYLCFFDKDLNLYRLNLENGEVQTWHNRARHKIWFAANRNKRTILVHDEGFINFGKDFTELPVSFSSWFEPDKSSVLPSLGFKHLLIPGKNVTMKNNIINIWSFDKNDYLDPNTIYYPDGTLQNISTVDYSDRHFTLIKSTRSRPDRTFYQAYNLAEKSRPHANPMRPDNYYLHAVGHDGVIIFVESEPKAIDYEVKMHFHV